jgi:2-polyprenyl-6-hydroxyphenyl methylase/3-demethylubiquinone-9 3-methyltransferase
MSTYAEYDFLSAAAERSHKYLGPTLQRLLRERKRDHGRLLDLGCGNGALTSEVLPEGWEADAVDLSATGIRHARAAFAKLRFHSLDVTGDLNGVPGFGSFDAVVSAEVVEHVYLPRKLAKNAFDALTPGGAAYFTTPYHGYWKNVVMALTGKLDAHFTVLWDGGHIKFWSRRTLTQLLEEVGFRVEQFVGVGRVPFLWKSMILVARKPR